MPNYTPSGKFAPDKALYRVAQEAKTFSTQSLLLHNQDENSHPDKVKSNRISMYTINKTESTLVSAGSGYKVGAAYLKADSLTYIPIYIETVDESGAIQTFRFPTDKVYADISIAESIVYQINQFENTSASLTFKTTLESVDINTVNLLEDILDLRTIGMIYYTDATASTGGSEPDPEEPTLHGTKYTDLITIVENQSSYEISHGLDSRDVLVQVSLDGELIYVNTNITSPNVVTLNFENAATALVGKEIRVIILNIAPIYGGRSYKFTTDITIDENNTSYDITHNLGTEDVFVQLNINGEIVLARTIIVDASHVKIDIGNAATGYNGQTAHVIIV